MRCRRKQTGQRTLAIIELSRVLYDLPVFSVLLLILVGADQHAGRLWPQRPQHIFDQGARMQPDQTFVHPAQPPTLAPGQYQCRHVLRPKWCRLWYGSHVQPPI
jgi:hypothetical protein